MYVNADIYIHSPRILHQILYINSKHYQLEVEICDVRYMFNSFYTLTTHNLGDVIGIIIFPKIKSYNKTKTFLRKKKRKKNNITKMKYNRIKTSDELKRKHKLKSQTGIWLLLHIHSSPHTYLLPNSLPSIVPQIPFPYFLEPSVLEISIQPASSLLSVTVTTLRRRNLLPSTLL